MAEIHPVTSALKNAVAQGSRFELDRTNDDTASLRITGGISDIVIPVKFVSKGNDHRMAFHWASNPFTIMLIMSAIQSLPDQAEPMFILSEEHLLLAGEWETKRGRALYGKKHQVMFLLESNV